jgi:hypothetical protein
MNPFWMNPKRMNPQDLIIIQTLLYYRNKYLGSTIRPLQ